MNLVILSISQVFPECSLTVWGCVKTVTDSEGGKTVRTYYVSAQLVELETTRVVWLDESTIKKVISRSAYTW